MNLQKVNQCIDKKRGETVEASNFSKETAQNSTFPFQGSKCPSVLEEQEPRRLKPRAQSIDIVGKGQK